MKYFFCIFFGLIFGVAVNHLGYLTIYDYSDHEGKLFLGLVVVWLSITVAVVYSIRKKSLKELSAKYFIRIFFLIQLGSTLGMACHTYYIQDDREERQEEFLYKFLSLDTNATISMSELYDRHQDYIEFSLLDFMLNKIIILSLFMILSIIPILLIKVKPKGLSYGEGY